MKRGSPAASIIGGAGLLAISAWGISQGRLPIVSQMVDDIDVTETPRIFWAYIVSIGAIGLVGLIWGLITSFRDATSSIAA